jgi:outer membrane lipoprotein SlyB
MRTMWLMSLALMPVCLGSGCSSMNNTDAGVLGGGVLGAGLGALIGGPRHALAGAAIGGATGAVTGGLIGNSADQKEKQVAQAQAAQAQAAAQNALSLTDIAQMAQQHISDEVIISRIRTSSSVFRLSANDIAFLKANGVSDPVIMEMNATANRVARPVIVGAAPPPPYAQPVYVVEPAPVVGVGFGYRRGW